MPGDITNGLLSGLQSGLDSVNRAVAQRQALDQRKQEWRAGLIEKGYTTDKDDNIIPTPLTAATQAQAQQGLVSGSPVSEREVQRQRGFLQLSNPAAGLPANPQDVAGPTIAEQMYPSTATAYELQGSKMPGYEAAGYGMQGAQMRAQELDNVARIKSEWEKQKIMGGLAAKGLMIDESGQVVPDAQHAPDYDATTSKSKAAREGLLEELHQSNPKIPMDRLKEMIPETMTGRQVQDSGGLLKEMVKGGYGLQGQKAKAQGMNGLGQVRRDALNLQRDKTAAGAAQTFDKSMQQYTDRINQAKIDRHTIESSEMIPSQVMEEVSTGIATLISGGKQAHVSTAEEQRLNNVESDWAKIKSYWQAHPQNAMNPTVKKQALDLIDRLTDGWGTIRDAAAKRAASGREYQNTPEARRALQTKLKEYKYTPEPKPKGLIAPEPTPTPTVNGLSLQEQAGARDFIKNHPNDPRSQVFRKALGM